MLEQEEVEVANVRQALLVMSVLVASASGILFLIDRFAERSGFGSMVGHVLGWLALGAGNVICLMLNGWAWRSDRSHSWLRNLVLLQTVPALIFFGVIAWFFFVALR